MNKRDGAPTESASLRARLAKWMPRARRRSTVSSVSLGVALLSFVSHTRAATAAGAAPSHRAASAHRTAHAHETASSHHDHRPGARDSSTNGEKASNRPAAAYPLPVIGYAYSSELALAVPDWVSHPSVAFGVEFPRGVSGKLSYFPTLRVAYEHHTDFQQRLSVGAVPALRYDFHRLFAAQFGIEVGGAYLRSLWSPHTFDETSGTWSEGEGDVRLTWQLGPELTLWTTPFEGLGFGVFYGITVLYPLAPANDVPALPLTKLGLCGRWVL